MNLNQIILLGLLYVFKASAFDKSKALNALYYSKAAYCDDSDVNYWTCGPCKNNRVKDVTASDTKVFETDTTFNDGQSYVTYNSARKQIVVAFRGTHNTKNWVYTNLNAWRDDFVCSGCGVHNGF